MSQRFFTFVLTVALLGCAGAVQADPVIYDNGIVGADLAFGSEIRSDTHSQTADDFVLPTSDAGWLVTDVHWTGFQGDGGTSYTNFRVLFYADNGGEPTGGGSMDDPTPTALAVRSTTATVMDSPDSDLIGLNDYWADCGGP